MSILLFVVTETYDSNAIHPASSQTLLSTLLLVDLDFFDFFFGSVPLILCLLLERGDPEAR